MAAEWHSADQEVQELRRQQRSMLFAERLSRRQVTALFVAQAWRQNSRERYFLALALAVVGALLLTVARSL